MSKKKEQQLINEVLQDQIRELEHQLQEQRQEIKELTKINRNRRHENDTVEHIKELVLAEINPMIKGLSQCEVGTFHETTGAIHPGTGDYYTLTKTVSFTRTFSRVPKVAALGALSSYDGVGDATLGVNAASPTTTKFDLYMAGYCK